MAGTKLLDPVQQLTTYRSARSGGLFRDRIVSIRTTPPTISQKRICSEKIAELLLRETSVADDPGHRVCIHRIVPWNRHDSNAIRHHNVLALSCDGESRFLQCLNGSEMRNARYPTHNLSRNLNFAEFTLTRQLACNGEVLLNSIPDVRQGLFFGPALRPTARQTRT